MPSLGGWPEAPCVRCGKRARIAWGELCPLCTNARMDRAIRWSRWVALGAALVTGLYGASRAATPPQRWYVAIAAVAVYVIARRIVTRLAMEFLPRDWERPKA